MREEPRDMSASALVAEIGAHGVRSMRGDDLTREDWARYREVADELDRRLPNEGE